MSDSNQIAVVTAASSGNKYDAARWTLFAATQTGKPAPRCKAASTPAHAA